MSTPSAIEKKPPFPQNYADEFLVIDHGKGVYLWDRAGQKYLDFTAGIAVNALGYGRADLAKIAAEQMKKVIHVSNLFTTQPAVDLAKALVASGDFAAVHLGNSGTEANEGAMKYARAYALRTKGEGHHKMLSFHGAFHGRTLGAISLTPTEKYQKPYFPLLPGCESAPFNDLKSLERLDRTYAAVLLEPLQGEGGLTAISPAFAKALQEICAKHDILIIADEIQSGLGRTGTLFAHTQLGLKPDIVTLSKPLAGGLPLSATLIPKKVNDIIHVGDHGTTFGGGPVTSAVALHVWKTINNPDFLADVAAKGTFFKNRLKKLAKNVPFAKGVKGMGLLVGLELIPERAGDIPKIIEACRAAGLLILRAGTSVLRFAPPLTIKRKEIDEGLAILAEVLKKF